MHQYHKNLDNTISVSNRAASLLQGARTTVHMHAYCEAFRRVITSTQLKDMLREKSPVFKVKDFEIKGTSFYCPESSCHAPLECLYPFDHFSLKEKGRHGSDCRYFDVTTQETRR